jgi:hypothetical protein
MSRIKELAEQARKALATDAMSGGEFNMKAYEEKFAELIVRECANVIADNDLAKDCGTIMMDSYAKGMRYSAHLIKEHFGVK